MTGPEPASVTASRQLAADSRDRRRRLPELLRGLRRPGGADAGSAGRPAIRPLGRPPAEHLDVPGPVEDVIADEWRLGRGSSRRDPAATEED